MAEQPRCVVPEGTLLVTRDVAKMLYLVLQPGLRQAQREQWRLTPGFNDLVAGLRYVLDEGASSSTPVVRAEPRWITTAEAAVLLGVSERQVCNKAPGLTHRKHGGRWLLDEADVLAEVEARSAFGAVIGSRRK